jgi:hypothetical protein
MIEFLFQAHYTAAYCKNKHMYDFVQVNIFERKFRMKNHYRAHATKPEGIEN